MQGEPTRRGSGLEEDCQMEVEEETDCKKKLDEQRKSLQNQLRDIEKFMDMEPMVLDSQNKRSSLEKQKTELLPDHQKVQKRSQKLQSLQEKKRHFFKEACEEEMWKVNEEVEERRVRFEALSERSGSCRRTAVDLEDEIEILQAGEERRGICAWQSNGCCFDLAMVHQVFACGAVHTEHFIQAMQEEFNRRFEAPAAPEPMAGGGERERLGRMAS